ncbi:hypothetical protein ISS22_07600 [candidate division KSB1 bacterium]|nr:hypothetical protein [candidate division KSB1 bacterium]
MKRTFKIILFGFLTWLIPFIVAFFFYDKNGQPTMDILFIKSILMVVSSIFGAYLLVVYFKQLKENFLKEGLVVGFSWLIINWLLDIVILLPMAKMAFSDWFTQIGLRYLVIPVFSISFGYIAQLQHKN